MKILVLPPHPNSNASETAYGIAASQPDRVAFAHYSAPFCFLYLLNGYAPEFDVDVRDVHELKSVWASNRIDEDVDWVVHLGDLDEPDLDALLSRLDVVVIPTRLCPRERRYALSTWLWLEWRREAQGGAIPTIAPLEIYRTTDIDHAWKRVVQMREKWRDQIGRFPRMLPPPLMHPLRHGRPKKSLTIAENAKCLVHDCRQIFQGCQWLLEKPDMQWDEIQQKWKLNNM